MNKVIDFILTYWMQIICLIAIVYVSVLTFKEFFSLSRDEQVKQIKAWLLSAVTLAEAEFGSGTGKIKLSVVYDRFVERFPWIARVLSFEKFSKYVDDALLEMKQLLATNKSISKIVDGEKPSIEKEE